MTDSTSILSQAVDNLNTQQFSVTEGLCQDVLEAEPQNARAWHLLGIAQAQQGELEQATQSFEKSVEHGGNVASYHYNLGLSYRRQDRDDEAIECYQRAIEVKPDFFEALSNLGSVLYNVGRNDEAIVALRECINLFPDSCDAQLHMLAALTGDDVPDRCNDDYVRTVFDKSFAESFDEDLANLNYRGPELISEALDALNDSRTELDVLDAGCGTGLCAEMLSRYSRKLVGLDLSPDMLSEAEKRDHYDDLVEDELTRYLKNSQSAYDLILVADTFCYFGSLDEALPATFEALRPNGVFIFSVEHLQEQLEDSERFRLQDHGRYCHDETYIRDTLQKCGFKLIRLVYETLRTEYSSDVPGLVVTAIRDS